MPVAPKRSLQKLDSAKFLKIHTEVRHHAPSEKRSAFYAKKGACRTCGGVRCTGRCRF